MVKHLNVRHTMKRTIAPVLATLTLLPAADMAQTFTFTTNSSPGVTVSTSPFGTGIGVSTPLSTPSIHLTAITTATDTITSTGIRDITDTGAAKPTERQ